jgi:hypothetical protein
VIVLLLLGVAWIVFACVSAAVCWYRLTRPITALDHLCSRRDLALRVRERRALRLGPIGL